MNSCVFRLVSGIRVNKNCTVITPSQLQSLTELTGAEGQTDGKLCSSGKAGTDGKDIPVCIHVCVAPPMIVGAWSMAIVLWKLLE